MFGTVDLLKLEGADVKKFALNCQNELWETKDLITGMIQDNPREFEIKQDERLKEGF